VTPPCPSGLHLPFAETGSPSGVAVLLVHALAESWRFFDPGLRRLPASVHAYDPPSAAMVRPIGPPDGYRPEDFATDIVDFMDVIGERRAVLGSSSGGLVSQIVASRHPDRVSALILISSPATLADKPGVSAMREEISALSDPLERAFVEDFVRATSPESVPEDFVEVLIDESLKAPALVWKETLRGLVEAELPVALDRIKAPTLLISGDQDAFVSDDQEFLLRCIPGARLLVYEGVGHTVHLADPDRVVADLVAFIDRHIRTAIEDGDRSAPDMPERLGS
jgi:pimeloyl-ACP methyl ester carboxylesterase